MAAKVETLRMSTSVRKSRTGIVRVVGKAVVRWGRKGQLGGSSETELGRLTGGRI